MEFFTLMTIPQMILYYAYGGVISYNALYISFGVAGGLYLLLLILGGFGLYAMAKKQGIKHAWLGFLPFANTYFAGKVAGEANFFGQKMKRAGLYAMLAEILYVGMSTLDQTIVTYLCNAKYWPEGVFDAGTVPIDLQWMVKAQPYCDALSYLAEILMIVFFFVVYIALFRKYYARGPMLMAFLSALFPFRGITLFAVRKNTPVDYNAYMRRRMEEAMRQQQQYGGGSFGGYHPPSGGSSGDSPYSDFGGGGQDKPFSEFGDSNDGNSSGGSGSSDDSPFSDF